VVDLPESVRSTITPDGIIHLANRGVFPQVSHQTIQDKGKADVLAKILVCFQVSFLVIQVSCISRSHNIRKLKCCQSSARKAGGYPLTLLEAHTLVHVVCALLMYALWFRKPLNIQDPTVVPATPVVMSCFKGETPDKSQYLLSRARNITIFMEDDVWSLILLLFGLLALCTAYGGVHLSAWNFHFPTEVEHYLWKGIMHFCHWAALMLTLFNVQLHV
jgi:hypothetical protein